jgi:hypothetical protein
MRIKFSLASFTLLVLINSCAFHTGTFQPSVVIPAQQYRLAGTAFGKVATFHLLGVGGLSHDAIIYEARQQIMETYPLPKGMILANATVNVKQLFVFIGIQTTYTVTCDLIDTRSEYSSATYKGFYTDDSTYFPLHYTSPPISENEKTDKYGSIIKEGAKVKFHINAELINGNLVSIDKYGFKCEYETPTGKRKIYLRFSDFYIAY